MIVGQCVDSSCLGFEVGESGVGLAEAELEGF